MHDVLNCGLLKQADARNPRSTGSEALRCILQGDST